MTTKTQQADRSWFAMRAAKDDQPAEILVYDEIGMWGIDATAFDTALKSLGDVKAITMRVNSPGGNVFDGVAIYNMLNKHPAKITAHIDGLAASAASLIVMAADEIVAPENTFMLIHEPYALSVGPASVHQTMADDLTRMTEAFANVYAARTKQTVEAVRALMAEDRLMGAKEAAELGYVSTVEPPKQAQASYSLDKIAAKHRDIVAKVFVTEDADAKAAAEAKAKADAEAAAEAEAKAEADAKAKAEADAAAAAAAEQPVYGDKEVTETLELCSIAGASSRVAHTFISAKKPLAEVRKALVDARATTAANQVIERVDTTEATAETSEQILARRREAQAAVKKDLGIGVR